MNKHEIIEQITKDPSYLQYCKKVCGGRDIYNDLYQHVILTLLEKSEKEIKEIRAIKPYISRIIWLSINSRSSEFYKQQIKEEWEDGAFPDIPEEKEDETFLDRFNEELDRECSRCIMSGVYPTSVMIYEAYTLERSFTNASKCLRIPVNTVFRHVKKTRELILKRINEDTDSNPA